MRGSAVFDQQLMSNFATMLKNSAGALEQQNQMADTTLSKLEQVWARLQDIGNTLANNIVGPLDKMLGPLLGFLNGLDALLHGGSQAKAVEDAIRGTGGRQVRPGPHPLIPLELPHVSGTHGGRAVQPHPDGETLTPTPQAYHPGQGGGVIIQNLNINGAPTDSDETWTKRIMQNISDALHRGTTHNQDKGWGWEQSAYTNGVDI
jgi:hypothetical protein